MEERSGVWGADAVRRFSSSASPAARITALAKTETGWLTLDPAAAVALYAIDRAAAGPFILRHLPWFGREGNRPRGWNELLERSSADPDFRFELYRRMFDEPRWRADVGAVCRAVEDPAALDAELERRHPRSPFPETASVFHDLLRARRRDVAPYVIRHASSIFARWRFGAREAKGLPEVVAMAEAEGWLDLWAALRRRHAEPRAGRGAAQTRIMIRIAHPHSNALGRVATRDDARGADVGRDGRQTLLHRAASIDA